MWASVPIIRRALSRGHWTDIIAGGCGTAPFLYCVGNHELAGELIARQAEVHSDESPGRAKGGNGDARDLSLPSTSLLVSVPGRGLTLLLGANSDGLTNSFGLAAGDVTTSPFGRLFLGLVFP